MSDAANQGKWQQLMKTLSNSRTIFVAASVAAFGLIATALYALSLSGNRWQFLGVSLLTAMAAALVGSLLGFLFGIPRLVSSGQYRIERAAVAESDRGKTPEQVAAERRLAEAAKAAKAAGVELASAADQASSVDEQTRRYNQAMDIRRIAQAEVDAANAKAAADTAGQPDSKSTLETGHKFEPSSNLAEVSDWLTKLLLGAGLVQLTQMSGPASSPVNSVAAGLTNTDPPAGTAKVAAGTIMVSYWTWGFLTTYVATTILYSRELNKV